MTRDDKLIEAAIEFDVRRLHDSADAGALHFVGVLEFLPQHISYKSRLSEQLRDTNSIAVDDDSLLFQSAEVLRLLLNGQADAAGTQLDELKAGSGIERLFVTLIRAWCFPEVEQFVALDRLVDKNSHLTNNFRARIYIKLMTWAMTSGGRSLAAPYYDKALENASGDLAKAIATVGHVFGRDSKIFFAPIRNRLVTYPNILDAVRSESRELIVRDAKNEIASPFTRTFAADPSALPRGIRSAELQAGWTGAYWVLENIWRTKGAILLTRSRERDEVADGITAWACSRGPSLNDLVLHYEHMLTPGIIEKILISDLLAGERLSPSDWQELCSGIWDQLPTPIALQFIYSLEIPEPDLGENSYPEHDGTLRFFNNLALVDRKSWSDRFGQLTPSGRLAVASMMPRTIAISLPARLKSQLRKILLEAAQLHGVGGIAGGFATETLAALADELSPSSKVRATFLKLIERESAAEVALLYPDLARVDLIEADLEQCKTNIRSQLKENQQGRWSRYSRSPLLRAAQCMIATNRADSEGIGLILDVVRSNFSSSDDVIDAVNALNWLADANLLPSQLFKAAQVSYRVEPSMADMFWQGRNDLRAMNTVIAGLLSKYPETSSESVDYLIAAARDPDIQVRLLAMEQFASSRVILADRESAVDATILGGIYDPANLVQARAIKLIHLISNEQIRRLAWARVVNDWPTAHRRVRVAAAMTAAYHIDRKREPQLARDVLALASRDRSVVVRRAVKSLSSKQPSA